LRHPFAIMKGKINSSSRKSLAWTWTSHSVNKFSGGITKARYINSPQQVLYNIIMSRQLSSTLCISNVYVYDFNWVIVCYFTLTDNWHCYDEKNEMTGSTWVHDSEGLCIQNEHYVIANNDKWDSIGIILQRFEIMANFVLHLCNW